jgi:hypothetical protein
MSAISQTVLPTETQAARGRNATWLEPENDGNGAGGGVGGFMLQKGE